MTQGVDRARGLVKGFTPGQRGVVAVAVLALILGTVALTRWAAQPTWTPLFSDLAGSDASAVVEQLRADSVEYKLADGGSTVLVPQSQVYDLRVQLAGKGLPANDGNSYSILDDQGLTATDFQQNIAYRRALEAELNKTLQAITGVRTAIVHLAIPQKDVFSTEQDKPTASVLLALQPGGTLTGDEVRAVTHLVAGAVEGLSPADVTVSDSTGALLSSRDSGAAGAASTAGQTDAQTAQYENRLSEGVQAMLDKVVGPGHAVVRVNAQLNYDTRATTSQRYVSESGVAPLAESTVHETYDGGADGSGGNLGGTYPTLTPGAGGAGGGTYDRTQRTADNAVGSVVESAEAAPGSVERLTVAVVLDSEAATDVDTTAISSMVSNAIGIDSTRGDTVDIAVLPFDTEAAAAVAEEVAKAESAARTAQYLDLGKKAAIGLAVLIFLLVLKKRSKGRTTVQAYASDLPDAGGDSMLLAASTPAALTAGPSAALPATSPDQAAIDAAQSAANREQLRDEVAKLVQNQPDEVAQVIQGWLSQRQG
ncbi:MAG: flagellar basal-body MS-ring/collar protein FliF [Kineosporiaceae bacterium]|jgi:flagellar M-ring protein FliF